MKRPPLKTSDRLAFAAEGALRHIVDPDARNQLVHALLDYARDAGLDLGGEPIHLIRPEVTAVPS